MNTTTINDGNFNDYIKIAKECINIIKSKENVVFYYKDIYQLLIAVSIYNMILNRSYTHTLKLPIFKECYNKDNDKCVQIYRHYKKLYKLINNNQNNNQNHKKEILTCDNKLCLS